MWMKPINRIKLTGRIRAPCIEFHHNVLKVLQDVGAS
jgi:hypothetical protein